MDLFHFFCIWQSFYHPSEIIDESAQRQTTRTVNIKYISFHLKMKQRFIFHHMAFKKSIISFHLLFVLLQHHFIGPEKTICLMGVVHSHQFFYFVIPLRNISLIYMLINWPQAYGGHHGGATLNKIHAKTIIIILSKCRRSFFSKFTIKSCRDVLFT